SIAANASGEGGAPLSLSSVAFANTITRIVCLLGLSRPHLESHGDDERACWKSTSFCKLFADLRVQRKRLRDVGGTKHHHCDFLRYGRSTTAHGLRRRRHHQEAMEKP